MNLKYQINLMLKYVSKYILKAKDLKMTGIQHLTRSVAGFLSFQLIFTVNSAHKNYKLYLPYSKTTLHLQNNFFAYGHYDESSLRLRSQKNRIEIS